MTYKDGLLQHPAGFTVTLGKTSGNLSGGRVEHKRVSEFTVEERRKNIPRSTGKRKRYTLRIARSVGLVPEHYPCVTTTCSTPLPSLAGHPIASRLGAG